MLEGIVQFIGEMLLQVVVETLVEFGFHSLRAPFRRDVPPMVGLVGHALFGAAAGAISLWFLPQLLVPGYWRVPNLFLSPAVAGMAMVGLGAWRAKRGDDRLRIDRFAYGYAFAIALALVRFQFAH